MSVPLGEASRSARGALRRALAKLTASVEEIEADELRQDAGRLGATPIAECADRTVVTVTGTLRTVTLRPRAGVPALEAEVYDGTGTLDVVWLGRRRIDGIEPGRAILATGRVTSHEGRPVMYNPRYELRAAGTVG